MYNNELGRQIRIYSYNWNRYFVMIILFLFPISIIGFIISAILVFALLMPVIIGIITLLEWKYINQRITVYEHGLHLKTPEQNVSFSITDIEDIQFTKDKKVVHGIKSQSIITYFLFYVKLKDRRYFEMNLLPFESLFERLAYDNESIPDMPALVAFHDRWFETRKTSTNIKR